MDSAELRRNEDVSRWFENQGSPQTARERLRVLARLCRELATTPAEIVDAVTSGEMHFENQLLEFLQKERRTGGKKGTGLSPGYLANYVKAVQSWLDYNGLSLRRKIKLGRTRATPTLEKETIPTKDELRNILQDARPRERVAVAFMATSCVREQVLGAYKGLDGLRLGDVEGLDLQGLRFERLPAMVRVRAELSKTGRPYLTFVGHEAAGHLLRYLELRRNAGEELDGNAPVIRCAPGFETMGKRKGAANRGSPFITSTNIGSDVKAAIVRAGYDWRPTVLRRYFLFKLMNASWEGKVSRDWVEFWAGRVGDIEHVYVLHKGLPPSLIESMREKYAELEELLSTEAGSVQATRDVEARLEKVEGLLKGLLTRGNVREALASEGIWNLEKSMKNLGWGDYLEGDDD